MKREDTIKASKWHYENVCLYKDEGEEAIYNDGFFDGADWRINSVWHNTNEKPKNGAMIIALSCKYSPIICDPFNFDWEETVEMFILKKWAYVEDLMPDMED